MAKEWAFKITERNMSALAANFHHFEADALEALYDATTVAEGILVRHIKALCREKTGYMRAHTTSRRSPKRRAFEAGWWREDFIGHKYWDTKETVITAFYPEAIENGWHDRGGNFHEGDKILPVAMRRARDLVIETYRIGLKAAVDRNNLRGSL